MRTLQRKIKGSELKLIPDENHVFSNTSKETSVLVADWLRKTLSGAGQN